MVPKCIIQNATLGWMARTFYAIDTRRSSFSVGYVFGQKLRVD
jgi:hypothetical protein